MLLESVDASLEALLRAAVPLSASEIDVSFEPPTRDWSAKLTRPTVNVFLWDVKRTRERARTGVETVERNGQMFTRMMLPRVELRYLITVWASEHRDERALLGGLLRTAVSFDHVPATFVAPALQDLSPIVMMVPRAGDQAAEVNKLLEGQIKPSLDLLVITDVDTGAGQLVATAATSIDLGVTDQRQPSRRASMRRVAGEVVAADGVGRRVTAPFGSAVVNDSGRFLIAAAPGDEVVIDTDPPRSAIVPEHGGVVIV